MLVLERRQRLLEMLRQQRAAELETLAQTLEVSASTVRRDLDRLEEQGLVERTHGGAIYRGPREHPLAFNDRMHVQVEAKRVIGGYAAGLVEPNMTVLLDGGSTVYFAAERITARPLQVVTNSLMIANLFANDDQVDVVMTGGSLYPRTSVLVGPLAIATLEQLHADVVLMSTAGIFDGEAYNIHLDHAEVERAMLRQAARAVMLMDATKFGRKSLARLCSVDRFEAVVTDPGISEKWQGVIGDRL